MFRFPPGRQGRAWMELLCSHYQQLNDNKKRPPTESNALNIAIHELHLHFIKSTSASIRSFLSVLPTVNVLLFVPLLRNEEDNGSVYELLLFYPSTHRGFLTIIHRLIVPRSHSKQTNICCLLSEEFNGGILILTPIPICWVFCANKQGIQVGFNNSLRPA